MSACIFTNVSRDSGQQRACSRVYLQADFPGRKCSEDGYALSLPDLRYSTFPRMASLITDSAQRCGVFLKNISCSLNCWEEESGK